MFSFPVLSIIGVCVYNTWFLLIAVEVSLSMNRIDDHALEEIVI